MLHFSDEPSALQSSRLPRPTAIKNKPGARISIVRRPLAAAIALSLSLTTANALAATINVTSAQGGLNGEGQCTLRSAVIAANTNAVSEGCSAGSGTDIIDMSAIAGQTVSLIGDSIQITSALTINGANVTVSGGNAQRVFEVTNGASATINDLVISGGRTGSPGAGINVNTNATLTLNRSTISGNTATGGGGLGGGIFAQTYGTINVNQSTISGNSASYGGGVSTYDYGTVNLSNSTVSGNTATSNGGGIHAWKSEVHLLRSTVANNTVAADGYGGGVFLRVRNYTGQVTLTDSIIADSVGGVAGSEDCDSNTSPGYGQVYKYGVNLVEKGTGCELVASQGVLLTTDPGLGTLTNNGGQTHTHSIPSGSAARDPSPNSCPGIEEDQRSLARFDGSCDLGAFEYGGLAFQRGPDFEVTASDDSNDMLCEIAPGHCSLREAINASNANLDESTITFANSLLGPSPATITLSGDLLDIYSPLTIQGGGVTVDGDSKSRIFFIREPTSISEITLINGSEGSGGAISVLTNGILHMENSTLTGNTARNGGAISVSNNGTLNLKNSTLTGNSAQIGGAIYLFRNPNPHLVGMPGATASLEQSTLSGNQASIGGGISVGAASKLTLKSSTLIGNSAEGIFLDEGISIENGFPLTTKIYRTRFEMINSVIAGSSSVDCDDTSDHIEVSVLGGNLVEDGSCPSSLTGDPMLGPLADNGGLTFTHLPLIGSPLIDAGANAQISQVLDQRGEPRIASGTVDIGSVEFHLPPQPPQNGPNFVVTSSADDNDGICETAPGHCSLREAINGSNANDDHSTITFVPGVTTVTLQSQLPTLATTITIQGDDTLIQGADVISTRLLELSSSTVTLNNLTLADGNADGPTPGYNWGGCILSSNSDLTLSNSHVRDCQGYGGGGLNHLGGRLTILDSTITGNSVVESGGGLYFDGQELTVSRSTIAENYAYHGGGLQIGGASQAHIEQSTISGNYAYYGGGILTSGVVESGLVLQLVNATLSGNSAKYFAGAISANSGSITFLNTTVAGNTAGIYVGGIEMVDNPNLVISNSIFSNGGMDCMSNVTLAPTRGVNIMQNPASCNFSGPQQPLQVDPVLGPLADNGGPTLTHALLAGSPAINAGDNSEVPVELTTDQRGSGFLRIQSSAVDIGSFEIQSASQIIFGDGFE